MNRIIKFRALYGKKIYEVYSVSLEWVEILSDEPITALYKSLSEGIKEKHHLNYNYSIQIPRKEVTLIQFTGLKDKNGKEIYEKDIVTLSYQGDSGKTAMIVEWDNENFGWYFTRGKNPRYSLAIGSLQENVRIEVVSNIYENPELLRSK